MYFLRVEFEIQNSRTSRNPLQHARLIRRIREHLESLLDNSRWCLRLARLFTRLLGLPPPLF